MNDVQPNGEPKKIYLTKPAENPLPTTSTPVWKSFRHYSGEQVRIPPRRHMPPVDKNSEEYLTNHKKQRYWNSWEELYLVELWRRYKEEVTSINVPLPVYRKMMIAMRNRNMIVTAQDCRRKINTLNTRYKQELLRMESTGCKSEWRLFPLLHCVFQPKINEFDAWQELKIIKKLLDKIPKPIEVTTPVLTNLNNNNNSYQTPQTQIVPVLQPPVSSYQPRNSYQTSAFTANLSTVSNADGTSLNNRLTALPGRSEKSSILPFRNITLEQVEQLRQENYLLAEERDADLKRLHIEEANFNCFEEFIRSWTQQKEIELQRIKLITNENAKSIENEENLNVEQQLITTIIAK